MKGSKIVMECLREQGVDTIFGYPGGQIMPLYDALYDYIADGSIKHILTSHEQGATHAADGYARSTGSVGVCFATSGPGATNTVTGIATAYMDSSPIVVITGQVPLAQIGKDAFQEVDIAGITIPVTKHNYFIKKVEDIAPSIREAFKIAASDRPGPVLIDIPKDMLVAECDYNYIPTSRIKKNRNSSVNDGELKVLAEVINHSRRPVIYAGGGVSISNASSELVAFAEKGNIPVISTLMSLGTIPRNHSLSLGMAGMHGEKDANQTMHNCDLIITIGARFSDRVTGDTSRFAKNAKIIHIDIDESEVSKNIEAHQWIIGDIKEVLDKLTPLVKHKERVEWFEKIEDWGETKEIDETFFDPDSIFKVLGEFFGEETIIVTEVGQHQMWTAQRWQFTKSRKFITSGGLGTMGFGLGAAIGSKIANPDKEVLHISGDGCFRMNCNELATVSAQKLPITTIVLKNNTLGMVRQWQKLFFSKRYSGTDLEDVVDYVKVAEAFGLNGYFTTNIEELREALKKAKTNKKGNVIICDIHIDENVFPMVPPGEAINNQVFSED